jgi:hypothetical protein
MATKTTPISAITRGMSSVSPTGLPMSDTKNIEMHLLMSSEEKSRKYILDWVSKWITIPNPDQWRPTSVFLHEMLKTIETCPDARMVLGNPPHGLDLKQVATMIRCYLNIHMQQQEAHFPPVASSCADGFSSSMPHRNDDDGNTGEFSTSMMPGIDRSMYAAIFGYDFGGGDGDDDDDDKSGGDTSSNSITTGIVGQIVPPSSPVKSSSGSQGNRTKGKRGKYRKRKRADDGAPQHSDVLESQQRSISFLERECADLRAENANLCKRARIQEERTRYAMSLMNTALSRIDRIDDALSFSGTPFRSSSSSSSSTTSPFRDTKDMIGDCHRLFERLFSGHVREDYQRISSSPSGSGVFGQPRRIVVRRVPRPNSS